MTDRALIACPRSANDRNQLASGFRLREFEVSLWIPIPLTISLELTKIIFLGRAPEEM